MKYGNKYLAKIIDLIAQEEYEEIVKKVIYNGENWEGEELYVKDPKKFEIKDDTLVIIDK